MQIEIGKLELRDEAQWQALWKDYQDFYEVALSSTVTGSAWSRIHDDQEPVHGLAARNGAELVGFAHYLFHRSTWMVGETCYLHDLFVLPALRGKGIARCLIEKVADDARASGAEHLYWQTHQSNETARKLYDRVAENNGFIVYDLPLT